MNKTLWNPFQWNTAKLFNKRKLQMQKCLQNKQKSVCVPCLNKPNSSCFPHDRVFAHAVSFV